MRATARCQFTAPIHRAGSAARYRRFIRRLLERLQRHCPRPGTQEPCLVGRARPYSGRNGRLVPKKPRPHQRYGRIQGVPERNWLFERRPGQCEGEYHQYRRGIQRAGRPPTGGPHYQCPLRIECSQRPLGQPVRCPVWHRRHSRR